MKVISDGDYRKAKAAGAVKATVRTPDQYLETLRQIRDGINTILAKPEKEVADKSAQYITLLVSELRIISKQLEQQEQPKRSWDFRVKRGNDGRIISVSAIQE
jgi:hypothetical protein